CDVDICGRRPERGVTDAVPRLGLGLAERSSHVTHTAEHDVRLTRRSRGMNGINDVVNATTRTGADLVEVTRSVTQCTLHGTVPTPGVVIQGLQLTGGRLTATDGAR